MTEKVIAIIPARGSSKRLPRKNIYPLFGKPLLQWSIEACQQSRHIKAVYVSTEDPEIAALARQAGAQVIDRPADLAGDTVWTQDVLKHAVSYLEEQGVDFTTVARIQANSPQITAAKIDEAIEKLFTHTLWEVFSVNADGLEDAAIHILLKKCVFQQALSVYKGVVVTDYLDVHYRKDIEAIEQKQIAAIDMRSQQFLHALEKKYAHHSITSFVRKALGRPEYSLWQWQTKVPLATRWQAVVQSSEALQQLLASPTCRAKASAMTVLDLGCGFGMYWPVLREYGFRKFVGVDLYDLRRQENYLRATRAYVQEFCPDCETQIIMDDARNLAAHQLKFQKFDVILAVATTSKKIKSTGIPEALFSDIVKHYGSANCLPIFVEHVPSPTA